MPVPAVALSRSIVALGRVINQFEAVRAFRLSITPWPYVHRWLARPNEQWRPWQRSFAETSRRSEFCGCG